MAEFLALSFGCITHVEMFQLQPQNRHFTKHQWQLMNQGCPVALESVYWVEKVLLIPRSQNKGGTRCTLDSVMPIWTLSFFTICHDWPKIESNMRLRTKPVKLWTVLNCAFARQLVHQFGCRYVLKFSQRPFFLLGWIHKWKFITIDVPHLPVLMQVFNLVFFKNHHVTIWRFW